MTSQLQIFRLRRTKMLPGTIILLGGIALGVAAGIKRPDIWQIWLFLLVPFAMLLFLMSYFIRFRIEVSDSGISSGYPKRKYLAWKDVSKVQHVATGAAGIRLWKNGLELFGKSPDGKKEQFIVPIVELRRADQATLERIIIERTKHADQRLNLR